LGGGIRLSTVSPAVVAERCGRGWCCDSQRGPSRGGRSLPRQRGLGGDL